MDVLPLWTLAFVTRGVRSVHTGQRYTPMIPTQQGHNPNDTRC